MAWHRLSVDETRYDARTLEGARGITRFLLDNNIDADVMLRFLDGRGISADMLPVRLIDRPDDEVLAEAWRQDRVLLTHDPDFLNETLHPPETNPGVVVLPGGSGNLEQHLVNVGNLLSFMRPYRGLWLQTYLHLTDGGVTTIKGVNATTGQVITPWVVSFDDNGRPLYWQDDG